MVGVDLDTRLALYKLAESQKGLFSAAQAAELSVSYTELSRAVAQGKLRRPRRGVYAFRGSRPSRWEPVVAAALYLGPEAVVSHSTAASVHRLWCAAAIPALIELSVRSRTGARPEGVVLHRRKSLPDYDIRERHGVLVTSPTRTLVDIVERLAPQTLERTLDEGLLSRAWDIDALDACLNRAMSNAPGRARLARLLACRRGLPLPESMLESRAYMALRELEPYQPHYQLSVGGSTYVLDAAWPDQLVAAEIVGRRYRAVSRSTFDRERRKLNALAAAGWRVAHLTSAMPPEEMVRAVRELLIGKEPYPAWARAL